MNETTRRRLTASVTKAEQLRLRDEQHTKMIRELADSMGDNATETMKREEKAALAGDEGAIARHSRAARGRFMARRISGAEA